MKRLFWCQECGHKRRCRCAARMWIGWLVYMACGLGACIVY